jgi:uncharacterized membrane protein YraQ (UPF0718 family)
VATALGAAALPRCECDSVPLGRRLFGDGVAGAAASTFMLAAQRAGLAAQTVSTITAPDNPYAYRH